MKIYKKLLTLLFVMILSASCGIKSSPIPKSSLNIPLPDAIKVSVTDEGMLIENFSDKYTMLAERSEYSKNLMAQNFFKRLSFISPNTSYLDKDVKAGVTYVYRFKNFHTEYNTFSPAASRTLQYYVPVKIKKVITSFDKENICIGVELSSAVNYVSASINGKEVGNIKIGQECFKLPNTLTVSLLLIPFDYEGNPGIVYNETIKRDERKVLLPPQNAKALRQGDNIILSWDKGGEGDLYNVYLGDETGALRKLETTDITIYRYQNPRRDACVEFEISTLRGRVESTRIKISSCP